METFTKSITGRTAIPGVRIKSIKADSIEIEGRAVLFDRVDLSGEKFSPETDFWFKYIGMDSARPLLWDHSYDNEGPGLDPIGRVTSIKADETGLWFEATLDRASQYAESIERLIEMGVIGASSGSAPHMVRYIGQTIKSWPIVEISLTPTPAEPGTVGSVDAVIKALRKVGYTGELKGVVAAEVDTDTGDGASISDSKASADSDDEPSGDELDGSSSEPTESEIDALLDFEREKLALLESSDDETGGSD